MSTATGGAPGPPAEAPAPSAAAAGRRRLAVAPWVLGAVAAGVALRLWNLPAQLLAGDELHAVRAAVQMPLRAILTTYLPADPSIPLAALFRLLLLAGVEPGELTLRLPSLLCGLAALFVLPSLARGAAAPARVELTWLVAVAPPLILYSRIVRSYAPVVLLVIAAHLAFAAFWETGRRRAALGYVLAAAAAIWLHLGAGPIAVAPLVAGVADALLGRGRHGARSARRRDLLRVAATGGALAVAGAAFLLPALPSLLALVESKRVAQQLPLAAVGSALQVLLGSRSTALAAAVGALALAGLVVLLRRDPRWALYGVLAVAAQVGGLRLLSPLGLGHPPILARYLLPALPWALLWVAVGLREIAVALRRFAPRPALLAGVPGAALVLLLLATGPFGDPAFRRSSFMHDGLYLRADVGRDPLAAAEVPAPYRALPAGGGAVVEAPIVPVTATGRTFVLMQEAHGRPVRLSGGMPMLHDRRLGLRNVLPPDPVAIAGSGAAALVLHLDLAAEEERFRRRDPRLADRPLEPRRREALRRAAAVLRARFEGAWGPPDAAAAGVLMWDLSAREAAAPRRRSDRP